MRKTENIINRTGINKTECKKTGHSKENKIPGVWNGSLFFLIIILGITLGIFAGCKNIFVPEPPATPEAAGPGGGITVSLRLFTGSARSVMPGMESLTWEITASQGDITISVAEGEYPKFSLSLPVSGTWTFTVRGINSANDEIFTGSAEQNIESGSTTSISIPLSPGSGMIDNGATGNLNLTIKPENVLTMTLSYRVDGGKWYNYSASSGWDPDQGEYWTPYYITESNLPVGPHTLDLYFGGGSKFYFCTVAVNIWPGMTSDQWIKTNGEEYINNEGEFAITEEMVDEFVKTMGSVVFVNSSVDANTPGTGSIYAPVNSVSTAVDILQKANPGGKCNGTIMVSGETTIDREIEVLSGETLTIKGRETGASIENTSGRVFNITGGSLTLGENITLTGTNDAGNGGAVYVNGGNFTMKSGSKITGSSATGTTANGGAVYVNGGTFTMEDGSKITGSSAQNGGGVYVNGGEFEMTGTATLQGNTATTHGGGVHIFSDGTFTMNGGTIDGTIDGTTADTAENGGGVFVSGGIFYMNDGTITGNTVTQSGGGVCISGGTFTMSDSAVISGNTATRSGGGVFVSGSGDFIMEGGTIGGISSGSHNSAENGGGVYIHNGAFTMSDGSISGNTATDNGGGVYVGGDNQGFSTFTMMGGAIGGTEANSANEADLGGGVYVDGTSSTFFMHDNGTITNNNANFGGGVYVRDGTFTMNGGTLSGNTATSGNGGGVFVSGGSSNFTMTGGTIGGTKPNTAVLGGGVYVGSSGGFTLGSSSAAAASSPVVSGNTKNGNSPNNVYLDDTILLIEGELKKSKESGNIGISMATPGEEFTYGWGSSSSTEPKFFFSDDTERTVALSGSELSLNLVFVKGGSCTLNNKQVTLSDFWISPYEVTQAEFESIMTENTNGIDANPSYFQDNPVAGEEQNRRPVEYVRWYEAIVYCNLLSMKEGLKPCYTINSSTAPADWEERPDLSIHGNYNDWNSVTCNFDADGYRLPTEAEWEYAARGGQTGISDNTWDNIYSGSTTPDNVAWYSGNSDNKTHEVGKKNANALGLYDMSGNVREWCWNRKSEANDSRVMGGGYYSSGEDDCQVTASYSNLPISQGPDQGFRVVRSAQ